MTPTRIARRSDALYYDPVSRRELCDRVAYLEADLRDAGRIAKRVTVLVKDTDGSIGHSECGACGEYIGPFDAYCRWCGTRLEDA